MQAYIRLWYSLLFYLVLPCPSAWSQPTDTTLHIQYFRIQNFPHTNGGPVFFASDGLMWLFTGNELASFDGSIVSNHYPQKVADNSRRTILLSTVEDEDKNLYASYSNKAIYYYNRIQNTFKNLPINPAKDPAFMTAPTQLMVALSRGLLLLKNEMNALCIYNKADSTLTALHLNENASRIRSVDAGNTVVSMLSVKPTGHDVLIGTNNGLYRATIMNAREKRLINTKITQLCHQYIFSNLTIVNDSTIAFHDDNRGIGIFNPESRSTRFIADAQRIHRFDYHPSCKSVGLHSTGENHLMFACKIHGVCLINVSTGQLMALQNEASELVAGSYQQLVKDQQNNNWLINNNKLYRVDWPADTSALRTADTDTGEHPLAIVQPPKPYIRFIRVGNKPLTTGSVSNGQPIDLGHAESISIGFSGIEYEHPERLRFQYRLIGLSDDWQITNTGERQITYVNLGPGKYKFEIMAMLEGQNHSSGIVGMAMRIKPYWYQTLFFRILLGIILLAVLAEIFIWSINRSRQKLRNEFATQQQIDALQANALRAQMNPHFIFNCLNSIKLLVQNAQNDEATDYLIKFTKLIRSLLETADQPYVSLQSELETCKLYMEMEKLRFGNKFHYDIHIPTHVDCQSIDVPTLVIQPIVENAIWHGLMPKESRGTIRIKVEETESDVVCIVEDDGIGRAASKRINVHRNTHQSKGVSLTSRRLDLFNKLYKAEAELQVEDITASDGTPMGTRTIVKFSKYH